MQACNLQNGEAAAAAAAVVCISVAKNGVQINAQPI